MKDSADDRHLVLLHRLQHRRLRLGRRAIDFVGQHDVGEHRSLDELELPLSAGNLLQNVRSRDVHRHQVRRELDATEGQLEGFERGS